MIVGHTSPKSMSHRLAKAYIENQKEIGNSINILDLANLNFNPVLVHGYREIQSLEEDLVYSQELISKANHIALFYPTWWGTMPAKLKGFFDRIFLPGFAFKYEDGKSIPKKLLKGKTATIVTTMDTPPFYYKFIQRNLGVRILKNLILGFSGIKTTKTVLVGPSRGSSENDVRNGSTQSVIFNENVYMLYNY